MIYAPTYCPGTKCDPCKPPPVVGNVTVVGRKGDPINGPYNGFYKAGSLYYGSIGVEWSTWELPLWTPVSASVTITVSGIDAQGKSVSGSTTIAGETLFSGASTGFYIPLPPTNLGITVIENPQPIVTTLAAGPCGPSSGPSDVAVVFPDSRWPI